MVKWSLTRIINFSVHSTKHFGTVFGQFCGTQGVTNPTLYFMKRSVLLPLLGVVAIALAVFLANQLVSSNKTPQVAVPKTVKSVFVAQASNKSIPLMVLANGRLVSQKRVDLFSEVQGVLQFTGKSFRSGQIYRQGEPILKLDAAEFAASVRSAKSNFLNILSTAVADIL